MKYLHIILSLLLAAGCASSQKAATSGAQVFHGETTISGKTMPVTLTLAPDKTARMERDGSASGTWERDTSGYLTVTLTDRDGATISEVYVFIEENGSVTVLEHRVDGMALGSASERFTLKKQ